MKLPSSAFAVLCLSVFFMGCSPVEGWEQEYACTGTEQSSAYFAGNDPASATQQDYPLTIDFHLRSDSAMVKSSRVVVESSDGGTLRFSSRNKNLWINGQFSQADGNLRVVDERSLDIAGRAQVIRTTGQYVCKNAIGSINRASL
jgi:hypothetical protein